MYCLCYFIFAIPPTEGVVVCQEGGDVRSVPGSAEEVLKSLVVGGLTLLLCMIHVHVHECDHYYDVLTLSCMC